MAWPNEYSPWLIDSPNVMYQAMKPKTGMGGAFTDWWRTQESNTYNDYLGSLGQQAMGGNAPNKSYYDHLSNKNWMQDYYSQGPSSRGSSTRSYGPRAAWNVWQK